ncbi:NAD(P)-dependent alcohol dehydrogenase [Methylocaldum sp. RMAD-M]|uniref:zinc-dependent alcohol dehydrogenase family protein n=1 Tax=Methylocaldum sp. RMAD-M TaxID=2806557 RepID=UPI000A320126|nr:NAD(P)-dependent alcohol dehydrogenase [Methylocaldum sp. RMAD-M]MBP1151790.1 NADPH:quinone reductase-like Zn-dependent oxidoreductase [Methylocaldum sp. RMAD-M]MDV3241547.1 NAD(P)-dependent alcohol dehydrogenase [Methylocaldum sp.]
MKVYELQGGFGIDSLALVERPMPRPAAGQVLLKMRAWSLNYRDLMLVNGSYNPNLRLPMTPLSDGVGEVVDVGPGVSRLKPGERVAGIFMPKWLDGELTEEKTKSALGGGDTGMAAEYVVLDAEGVVPVPDHLTDEEAATLPCAAVTAWHALVASGRVKAGDTVLTLGTGGVSLFALQFAKLSGARVIATSSSDEKLARALDLGALEGINYKNTPEWGHVVRELTDGVGVDHVVEVGGAGTLGQSLRAVRMGGRISLIGVLSGGGQVDPTPILMKNVCVQGIFVGSRAMFEAMNEAIAQHRMRPVVDRVFRFGELPDALRHMERGAHFGKIALAVS